MGKECTTFEVEEEKLLQNTGCVVCVWKGFSGATEGGYVWWAGLSGLEGSDLCGISVEAIR